MKNLNFSLKIEANDAPLFFQRDPRLIFQDWLKEAVDAHAPEPTAFCLSTLSQEGEPQGRMLLFKGMSEGRFSFFTNYQSKKADELFRHPFANMVFFWPTLSRQIRITGTIEKTSEEESDAYFASRPRGSQIGAWASEQSQKLNSKEELLSKVKMLEKQWEGKSVLRPPHWGGFALTAHEIEFWIGQESRLHDRYKYVLMEEKWFLTRLSP